MIKYLLLLLLGWAMIGQGMWKAKKGVSTQRLEKVALVHVFNKRLAHSVDEIIFALGKYETQMMLKQLEQEAEIKRLRKLQPQASIKITLNMASTIPDCHHPNTIIYKYTYPVDKITNFKFCSLAKRVYALVRPRKNILVKFTVCADEQMCKESYMQTGTVLKLDDHLVIIPPQFEDKFVSCCIEYPIDGKFSLERHDLKTFMQDLKEPAIPESDSSDLDLSDEEDSEQG